MTRKTTEGLRRMTFGDFDAPREPPSLAALMDRARAMHAAPHLHFSRFLDLLREDAREARACLDAVEDAIENAPRLKRLPAARVERRPRRSQREHDA